MPPPRTHTHHYHHHHPYTPGALILDGKQSDKSGINAWVGWVGEQAMKTVHGVVTLPGMGAAVKMGPGQHKGAKGNGKGKVPVAASKGGQCKLYVGHIASDTCDQDLRKLFKRYGKIKRIRIAKDHTMGQASGFLCVMCVRARACVCVCVLVHTEYGWVCVCIQYSV